MATLPCRRNFEPQRVELTKLFSKLPPHAIEAEMALLGAMILDGQVIGDVVQVLKGSEDFYKPSHAAIYQALVDMFDHNEPIEIVHLRQKLADRGELETMGGVNYLLELADSVPSAVGAPHYAKLVREKSVLRKLIEATGKILYDAYTSSEPVEDLLDAAEQEIFRLAESKSTSEATDLQTLLQETYNRLEQHDGRVITGLETGYFELDEMMSGLQNGEMIILAARPSMGKTALALNIAEHIGANNKQPVAVFSLEMSKQ